MKVNENYIVLTSTECPVYINTRNLIQRQRYTPQLDERRHIFHSMILLVVNSVILRFRY